MKRLIISIILLFSIITASATAQEEAKSTAEAAGNNGYIKGLIGELGYGGPADLSAAIGFRYWFASATIGIAGFAKKLPAYSMDGSLYKIYPSSPTLPSGFDSERNTALIITGDLAFYYDKFDPFTLFASIGYYTQQDSILAVKSGTGDKYYWTTANLSGLCFGVGAEYFLNDDFNVGLGYHTKRGLFAKLVYFWF